jgi:hypothetical protein
MQESKTIGRRELLRGGGVAALVVGAAAVVPFVAKANDGIEISTSPAAADAKVMSLGEQCLKQIAEVRRVGEPCHALYEQCRDEEDRNARWRVYGAHFRPDGKWYALARDFRQHESERWLPLSAKTEKAANKEACQLDARFFREHMEQWERISVKHNRHALYDAWAVEHSRLGRMVNRLARLRAATPEGINMKAIVIALARTVFDEGFWCEKLEESLMADIAKNAKAAA